MADQKINVSVTAQTRQLVEGLRRAAGSVGGFFNKFAAGTDEATAKLEKFTAENKAAYEKIKATTDNIATGAGKMADAQAKATEKMVAGAEKAAKATEGIKQAQEEAAKVKPAGNKFTDNGISDYARAVEKQGTKARRTKLAEQAAIEAAARAEARAAGSYKNAADEMRKDTSTSTRLAAAKLRLHQAEEDLLAAQRRVAVTQERIANSQGKTTRATAHHTAALDALTRAERNAARAEENVVIASRREGDAQQRVADREARIAQRSADLQATAAAKIAAAQKRAAEQASRMAGAASGAADRMAGSSRRLGRYVGSMRNVHISQTRVISGFRGIVTAAAVAIPTYQVAKFGAESVKLASDTVEANQALQQVFGKDSLNQINKFAKAGADNLGLTALQAKEAIQFFGVYGQQAGLAQQDNIKFSEGLTKTAVDLASFYNTKPEDALVALRAGLRNESKPLRRYGVLINASALKAEALRIGLLKATKNTDLIKASQERAIVAQRRYNEAVKEHGKDSSAATSAAASLAQAQNTLNKRVAGTIPKLTQQQTILAAQALIMRQTKTQSGDFNRTKLQLANQGRIIKAEIGDISEKFGEGLLPVVKTFAVLFSGSILPAVKRFADVASPAIEAFFKPIQAGSKGFKDITGFFTVLSSAMSGVQGRFDAIGKAAQPFVTIFSYLKAGAAPLGAALANIAGVGADLATGALKGLLPLTKIILKAFIDLTNSFAPLLATAGSFVGSIIDQVVRLLPVIVPILSSVMAGLGSLFTALTPIANTAIGVIKTILTDLYPVVAAGINAIIAVVNAVSPYIQSLLKSFGDLVGFLAPIAIHAFEAVGKIAALMAPLFVTMGQVIQATVDVIGQQLAPVANAIIDFIVYFVQTLVGLFGNSFTNLPGQIQTLSKPLGDLADDLVKLVAILYPLVQYWGEFLQLTGAFDTGGTVSDMAAVADTLSSILKGIGSVLDGIKAAVEIANDVIQAFMGNLDLAKLKTDALNGSIAAVGISTGVSIQPIKDYANAATGAFKSVGDAGDAMAKAVGIDTNNISYQLAKAKAQADFYNKNAKDTKAFDADAFTKNLKDSLAKVDDAFKGFGNFKYDPSKVKNITNPLTKALKDVKITDPFKNGFGKIGATGLTSEDNSKAYENEGEKVVKAFLSGLSKASPSEIKQRTKTLTDLVGKAFSTGFTKKVAYFKPFDGKKYFKNVKVTISKGLRDSLTALIERNNKRLTKLATQRDKIIKKIADAKKLAKDIQGGVTNAAAVTGGGRFVDIARRMRNILGYSRKFGSTIKQLSKSGLNKTSLRQLVDQFVQDPEAGLRSALALMQGGVGGIKEINTLQSQISSQSKTLGRNVADDLYDAGANAGKGFLSGLKSQEKSLEAQMQHLGEVLAKSVRKSLDIHSPSRVMRKLGVQTVAGLNLGLAPRGIEASGTRLAAAVVRGYQPQLQNRRAGSADAQATAYNGPLVHVTVEATPGTDRRALGREIVGLIDEHLGTNGGGRSRVLVTKK